MRNKKVLISAIILLLVASLGLAAFALQPTAEDLLAQAMETVQTVTDGHAVANFTVNTAEMNASGTVEMWGKLDAGPNGEPAFRAEILEATESKLVGLTAVTDGYNFWLWDPQENKVLVGNADEAAALIAAQMAGQEFEIDPDYNHEEGDHPQTPEEAVAKLLEYFTAERITDVQIGATNAHGLRLIPIPEKMPDEVRAAGGFLKVYVRPEDGAPLSVQYAEGAIGSGSATATTLELNQGVDNSLFTFVIPEGAEVVRLEDLKPEELTAVETADLNVLSPAILPADAAFVSATEIRGAVVQRYSRSAGGFTIAQGPATAVPDREADGKIVTLRGIEGTLYSDEAGAQSLLTWTEGDITFWIGGDLTAAEALALAEALQ
ncbi:MAG: outer membrane lipoprotein carrier protein LolA [Chloroflexi bacterium]|nr:outer membrane lipoprotein carrier protein LolA [Chloroflexota bacterium]